MDSNSQAAGDGASGRFGGKILKPRRIAARKTPYDRPTMPPQPKSPNWYEGLVYPAKFVAGGASKLFSSFWNPISWGSHSYSSDSESNSEGGIEDDYEDNENLYDGVAELNQNKSSSSGKSEILYLVEQLLMLTRYSREECDKLIKIIDSRVVDYTMREGLDPGPSKILSRTDIENPDIHNQTIMEARKLITKNMAGSSSKSNLDNRTHGNKSLTTPNRNYLSAGSWNIQDEIHRLRSKTTEDMLSNHQSPKLAAFTVLNDKAKPEDETVNLALEGDTLGFSDMRTTQDDLPMEALSFLPTIEVQNQMAGGQDAVSNNSEQNPRQSGDVIGLGKGKGVEDRITEAADVNEAVGYAIGSQGSSNTNDPSSPRTATRASTRSRRYVKRGRGRGRGK